MHTVKIIDGKPWVVKLAGHPSTSDYNFDDDGDYKTDCALWLTSATKYPTLETHLSHWQALEGKELQLGRDFQVEDHGHKCENGNGWASTYSLCATATPLPQPNEDEVNMYWLQVIGKIQEWVIMGSEDLDESTIETEKLISYLNSSFTLSKK